MAIGFSLLLHSQLKEMKDRKSGKMEMGSKPPPPFYN